MNHLAYTESRKPETREFLKRFVAHTQAKEVEAALLRSFKTAGQNPRGMVLIGETGVGKTFTLERFALRHALPDTETHSYQVVVLVEIPAEATIKATLSALLRKLGCIRPESGTKDAMLSRALKLMSELRTQLIVFDEFQHLLETQTLRHRKNVVNFIKSLMNITHIPVVLAGMPESALIINEDPQLARRFSAVQQLHPFSISSQKDMDYFANFMFSLQKVMPLKTLNLIETSMLLRLYLATDGKAGLISNLLEELIEQHEDENEQAILKHFAEAYDHVMNNPHKINPFRVSLEQVRKKLGLA